MHIPSSAKTLGLVPPLLACKNPRRPGRRPSNYPHTAAAWAANLEDALGAVFKLLLRKNAASGWLNLAVAVLAFEENRMGVDQILAVKPSTRGVSEMPASPSTWLASEPSGNSR